MRKRILSGLLACAVCVGMLPVGAMAAETDSAPALAEAAIAGSTGTADANGVLCLTVDSSTPLASADFDVTTTEAVSFVPATQTEAATGELYASTAGNGTATLNFDIDLSAIEGGINFNDSAYTISLTSDDGINWEGSFNAGFNTTMGALGEALDMTNARIKAGIMKDEVGELNEAQNIYVNNDAKSTQLVICDAEDTLYTVIYHYGNTEYEWTVPAGAKLYNAQLPENSGYTGWYTDEDCTIAADFNTAVVDKNMELFAKETEPSTPGDFLEDLKDGYAEINDWQDWEAFVNNSDQVKAGDLVALTTNIDCQNASYQALDFAGDFNGNNKTISNARFTANGDYSGMFASLGATQKVANLKLQNIDVGYAQYAGTLAGWIYGVNETPRENCMVQNIQVTDCSVSGYTAGGVVGYAFANTIRYCSSRNTTVTGVANGGGIVGISYGNVTECYSTASPTALLSRGRGGIAGKILESGNMSNCWYTYSKSAGSVTDATESNSKKVTDNTTSVDMMIWAAGHSEIWSFGNGDATTFNESAVTYPFPQGGAE
ncbi:MAG TPA: InlB B-repeat-containing protein [Firmicutes bacterium]|nr:InlB B-repeat-containing protein [Bacillota bacterium]